MQFMKYYVTMMENQFNKKVKNFWSDWGGEFKSHKFNDYLNQKGIVRQTSAPHAHQQNGCAERINQTLMEKAETMHTNSSCPRSWWEFTIDAAVHIYNCTPIQWTNWKTPYQNLYGKQPDVKYFRTFGCLAWVFIPKEIRKDKLSPKLNQWHLLVMTKVLKLIDSCKKITPYLLELKLSSMKAFSEK